MFRNRMLGPFRIDVETHLGGGVALGILHGPTYHSLGALPFLQHFEEH
jgi:hypothetical protein